MGESADLEWFACHCTADEQELGGCKQEYVPVNHIRVPDDRQQFRVSVTPLTSLIDVGRTTKNESWISATYSV